ncbi:Xylose isomerase domain protein TIM barrel OS=Melioribacter roseus (strain JCM 17771 / P3M-2) GN=MROS_2632 PE=4 SV=1: AP_endonuc_2 [Gemmata massiliana]|uniref:Xylose isomerase-like TIM barrel domain-containing protein n=1 Tax=Gemmata massiliana TaxID=1210884 RepID=A0A6P2D3U2_9BACT|nr:Xylose isomerase domain protein TIM barrel OS=Melioribacter roseus (strain JCM 17771 / P3M-2) GN=MROS_2632 PE=4 SV=1: AP_endonuc_2 [Gemmata massiliana]
MGRQTGRGHSTPIALQLWTIRDAIASDVDQALSRVRVAGFQAVELAPLPPGLSPERLAKALARHELTVVSIHGDLPTPANIEHWARITQMCRCRKIIWHGWPRDSRYDSAVGLRDLIASCNAAGNLAREHGLEFGLHNHWWEFELLEGVLSIRTLHEELHLDIFWQLDVYWARTAGFDPAGAVSELGSRLGSIHWKDGPAVYGQPMTALGHGTIDVPRILNALTHPVDWVIELDECASDPLEAARQSLEYLEARTS